MNYANIALLFDRNQLQCSIWHYCHQLDLNNKKTPKLGKHVSKEVLLAGELKNKFYENIDESEEFQERGN